MQLDLFSDSRDVMLRNDLIDALRSRNVDAGGRALAALAAEYPTDATLRPAQSLLGVLTAEITPFATHAEAIQAVAALEHAPRADAVALFGEGPAGHWLRPVRLALAQAAANLPYSAEAPDAHATGLYLRAGDWAAAEHHVNTIPAWRRIPGPLAWAAEASFHLHGLDKAWPLLAELAWLDAARFAALAQALPAPALARLLHRYAREHAATAADFAWFPAWALVAHPELRAVLQGVRTPQHSAPELACHLVAELLILERQGRHHDIVEQRKRLRALNPELFAFYMQTRA